MPKQQKRYLIQNSGQVTLPRALREKFSLQAGDEVAFESTSKGILVKPVSPLRVQESFNGVREIAGKYSTE